MLVFFYLDTVFLITNKKELDKEIAVEMGFLEVMTGCCHRKSFTFEASYNRCRSKIGSKSL
jgi:hypothetical protein